MEKFRIIVLSTLLALTLNGEAGTFRTRLHQIVNSSHTYSDVQAEILFGRTVAAHLLGRENLLDNTQLTKYVTLVGKSLALHSPRQELEFRFGVLDSDVINAYSTPGGYVFITRGALQLAQDEAELAAILAHEIAHINARHIVKQLNIRSTEQDNLSVLTRVVSASNETTRVAAGQALESAMVLLFKQGFKVQDEMEADQHALLILAATGYDPMALQRYLQRVDEYFSMHPNVKTPTHPSSRQRHANMDQLVNEENLATPQSLILRERFTRYVSKEE